MKQSKKDISFFKAPPDAAHRREIEAYLTEKHPVLSRTVLGKSVLGEEISLFRIGEGKRSTVYVGAHHGMEWITALLLYRFLDDFSKSTERRGAHSSFVKQHSLYVIPLLNPDGVEIMLHGAAAGGVLREQLLLQNGSADFTAWQANANGVDLNHNYDAGFAAYKALEKEMGIHGGGPTRYSGAYPLSEPESAALMGFLRKVKPTLVLTLHTQGEEIYYRKTEPPVVGAAEIGSALSCITGYRLATPEGAAAYGGLADALAEGERVPAYTLECGLGKNPLPLRDAQPIYLRLRRALYLSLGFLTAENGEGHLPLPPDQHLKRGEKCMSHVSGDSIREKEVINSCDGRRLGYVCDIEFDVCDGRITAIVVPTKGGFLGCGGENIVIPWEKICKIGEDIILVDAEGCCPPPKPPRKRG